MTEFPISGVETYWWLPVVTAFVISVFTSTGGVSGAFLLLPFQMSVLGFTSPAVSATNMLFNVVAIPSGVYRYAKERRLVKSLVWTTALGTLPGVLIGAIVRIKFFLDPRPFKFFVGLVLLYLGSRLIMDISRRIAPVKSPGEKEFIVRNEKISFHSISYEFQGTNYRTSFWGIFGLSLAVGVIGGIYGIGGGAIISPFLVAVFGLPIHTVAGAALLGTFITSIIGVIIYATLAIWFAQPNLAISPDWALGCLFGVGGAAGIYIGARLQRLIPAWIIKVLLAACVIFVAVGYIWGFFT